MNMRLIACAAMLAPLAVAQGIEGRVLEDHSGSGVASVEVRVRRIGAPRLIADVETEPGGGFRLPPLTAGEYRIEFSKANYIPTSLRYQGVVPPMILARLVRCGSISGRALDPQGRPLRGAIVYAMPKPADGGPLRPFTDVRPGSQTQVDTDGQFRLYYLPPGQYAVGLSYGASSTVLGMSGSAKVAAGIGSGVQLYPESARPQYLTINGGEEYRDINFNLQPGTFFSVSGKVEIPESASPGAQYWLTLVPAGQPSIASAATTADRQGNFRFEGIAMGAYQLLVSGPSSGRNGRGAMLPESPNFARTRINVGGQNLDGLALAPRKGLSAAFVVRGAAESGGACPESAQLTLTAMEDWAAVLDRTAEVGSKATVLENLGPALYLAHVGNLGERCYETSEITVDLTQGSPSEPVALRVAAAAAIRGKLTGARNPAGFAVAILPSDPMEGDPAVQFALPDPGGTFSFPALRPGKYRIAAQPASAPKSRWISDPARMVELDIPAGAPTDVELPAPSARPGAQP